jgi:hypothetical protein
MNAFNSIKDKGAGAIYYRIIHFMIYAHASNIIWHTKILAK